MGRKGLGKLAGFGAATKVVIRTKRVDDTFATTFTLDDSTIRNAEDLGEVIIPAVYEDGLPAEKRGTTITLTGLKPEAFGFSGERIPTRPRDDGMTPRLKSVTNDAHICRS